MTKKYIAAYLLGFVLTIAAAPFIPWLTNGDEVPAPSSYVLQVPSFVNTLNLTNPQIYRDSAGVLFAATRADSSTGGVVWRVDGYVSPENPGVITQVFPTDPAKYFANGELVLWPDGDLWYITVQVDNIKDRNIQAQVAYRVPGWTR